MPREVIFGFLLALVVVLAFDADYRTAGRRRIGVVDEPGRGA